MTNEEYEEREEHEEQKVRSAAQFPRLVEAIFYVVIAVSFGVGVVWWNEDPPMIVVERSLITSEVRPGDSIVIFNNVVATKICPVEIHRSIVDSIDVVHTLSPETVWPEQRLGRFNYRSVVTVPSAAASGPATYRVHARWRCNPLQELFPPEIKLSDVEVEIVP